MIDIDKFKQYNDAFGHQAGDNVLIRVAETLSKIFKRHGDIVARYGGEEFAIIPHTDFKGAIHLADSVCESIKELNIKHPHSSWNRLTVSCGVACMYPNNKDTQMALITSADMALYEAKRAGGNRYMWAKSQNGQRILINTKN